MKTGTCSVLVNETVSLSNTANLPGALKIGGGARVMLTNNLDISDRLINGQWVKYCTWISKETTHLLIGFL